jgi:hypothetical protein
VQYDKDDRIERQDFLGEFGFSGKHRESRTEAGVALAALRGVGQEDLLLPPGLRRWFEEQAKAAGGPDNCL